MLVFVVRDGFGLYDFALIGVLLMNPLKGAKHDVGSFVFATCALYADEESDRPSLGTWFFGAEAINVDGEGDECGLLREVRMIAGIVFVEAGRDSVAIVGNVLVEAALFAINPVGYLVTDVLAISECRTEIEVGVAEGLCGSTSMHPIVIHTVSAKEYFAIVSAQIVVDGIEPLGFEFEEAGIDKLHHIVSAKAG